MDVFISYSSKEFDKARFVRDTLQKNGIDAWMAPESIPSGSNYTKEIPAAIKVCKVFLLILSANAQKSVWVPAETEQAFKHEKIILPFVIDKCEIADEFDFMLSRSQRIDAYEKKADALEKLVKRLQTLLGKSNPRAVDYGLQMKKESPSENNYKAELCVDDVFTLSGRGKVIVGHVLYGVICFGDEIIIHGMTASVLALECNGAILQIAGAKDGHVGILVNLTVPKISKGDILHVRQKNL